MSLKYCSRCYTPVQMTIFDCPKCQESSFTHALPDARFKCVCTEPRVKDQHCVRCGNDIEPMRLAVLIRNGAVPPTVKSPANSKHSAGIKAEQEERAVAPAATPTIANIDLNRVDKNDIQALIRAQNRTTHAVRAFVRFLFIQLTATTAAVTLWNIGDAFINQQQCIDYGDNCSGNGFFYFIAGVVLIGGVVWSSAAGWDELGKSEVN